MRQGLVGLAGGGGLGSPESAMGTRGRERRRWPLAPEWREAIFAWQHSSMQKIMMCNLSGISAGIPTHVWDFQNVPWFPSLFPSYFLPKQICRLNTGTLYYEILIFQTCPNEKNIDVIQLDRHAKEKTKRSRFGSGNLDFGVMLFVQVQNQLLLPEQEGCNFHLV